MELNLSSGISPYFQGKLSNFNPSMDISNDMPNKVWDGIIYPFLKFNGCSIEV